MGRTTVHGERSRTMTAGIRRTLAHTARGSLQMMCSKCAKEYNDFRMANGTPTSCPVKTGATHLPARFPNRGALANGELLALALVIGTRAHGQRDRGRGGRGGALVIALAVYVVGCALFTAWFCRVAAITSAMKRGI